MTERAPLYEFQPWPKIPRLSKQITVTEKIDGSNAAVMVRPLARDPEGPEDDWARFEPPMEHEIAVRLRGDDGVVTVVAVGAQSRNRLIWPGKTTDNVGFAAWVHEHACVLARDLGVGRHFGEWWGQGIQRGYGIEGKRFSLFNPFTFGTPGNDEVPHAAVDIGLRVVPLLTTCPIFDTGAIDQAVWRLMELGSAAAAAEGVHAEAEGVVVRHSASGQLYKRLIQNDDTPKGQVTA